MSAFLGVGVMSAILSGRPVLLSPSQQVDRTPWRYVVSGVATRGGAAVDAKLTDLCFYISNVKMPKADGIAVAVTLDESTWPESGLFI